MELQEIERQREPLEAGLTHADDRIRLTEWLPPQWGEMPRIRFRKRWYNVLWIIPLGTVGLIISIALVQDLRQNNPAVQQFIARYPGISAAPRYYNGFPAWLRWQHFFNLFLIFLMIRAGIQILADHPRLYWNRDCTPGTEWFRFQHEVPRDRIWTSKDDSVTLPGWFGIPGIRHSIGLARWWHFSCDLLWVLNGAIFYVLLFTTYQWQRIVPQTWAVFPNALSTAIQYASLNFPADHGWIRYNGVQLLSYFITVFIAAPLAIITGLMQAPAISNRLGWFGKVFHRQAARSIHFLVLCWFVFFIFIHVTMIFITGLRQNLNHMFAGVNGNGPEGFVIFCIAMLVVIVVWFAASPFTLRHARLVQKTGEFMVGWLKGFTEWWEPNSQYGEKDISPHFWPNGTMPNSEEFNALVKNGFANYSLRVDGLVENPREFSFAELKALPKQEQITEHFCIQGWSGVAKWGGVPMRDILEIVKPRPEARYAVFYSFSEGSAGGGYYDAHKIDNMRHHLTILAYEMNGKPVSVLHGAPLRLRCENELGFKMVKWIEAIEFVRDFAHLGAGQGGYNEDHEFYGYRMPI
jgi:sulfoxide reductase catalytic subunit YedY